MQNKLKFNRHNLSKEIEELNQTIHEFSETMARAKRNLLVCEKEFTELQKDQKEDQKNKFAEIYQDIINPKMSDVKAEKIVRADERYLELVKKQKKEIQNKIQELGEKSEVSDIAISDYYTACGKRTQISDAIKMVIGGFFEINEAKLNEEVKYIKTKKLINRKKK